MADSSTLATWGSAAVASAAVDSAAVAAWLGAIAALSGAFYAARQVKTAKDALEETKKVRQTAIDQAQSATDQATSARKSAEAAIQSLAEQRAANRLASEQFETQLRHRAEDQAGAQAQADQAAQSAANRVTVETEPYTGNAKVIIRNGSGAPIREVRLIKVTGDQLPDSVKIVRDSDSRGDSPEVIPTLAAYKSGEFWLEYVHVDSGEQATMNAGTLEVVFRFTTDLPSQRWESSSSGAAERVSDPDQPEV